MEVVLVVTQKRCLTLSPAQIQSTKLSLEVAAHLWHQQHRVVLLGSKDKQVVQLLRLAQLRKAAKLAVRIWLVLREVPVAVAAEAPLRPIHKDMEAATAVMVLRHKVALAKDKVPRRGSSVKRLENFMLEAVAAAEAA